MPVANDMHGMELVEQVRSGQIRVYEIAERVLARIAATRSLNAFISVDAELIAAQARALDRRLSAGEALPLHGLPLIIKDNIDAAGFATTCGTPALRAQRPHQHAAAVQRLVDAGAWIAGKANLHELAAGVTNNNGFCGAVRNPYHQEMIAGGSSGGTAAAIAARQVPAGLATDTGGSARIPASLCGVCGFRPTTGRYPEAGVLVLTATRDTVGLMARTVADVARMDEVIAGRRAAGPAELSGLRVGLVSPFFEGLETDVEKAMTEVLQALVARGVEVVKGDAGEIMSLHSRCSEGIVATEVPRGLAAFLRGRKPERTPQEVIDAIATPGLRERFAQLCQVDDGQAATYRELMTVVRPQLQRAYREYFAAAGVEVLLYPTTRATARPIGEDDSILVNGSRVPTFPAYARNTDPGANAGLPAISIPVRLSVDGLPIGVSLEGRAGEDERLLAIGESVQGIFAALPPPPI